MNASALFKKTLEGYSRLSAANSCSLTKYCKEHHVNFRALRYWMKKNSIPTPRQTQPTCGSSLVPLSILPCSMKEKTVAPLLNEVIRDVRVSFTSGTNIVIEEISCQELIRIIHAINS